MGLQLTSRAQSYQPQLYFGFKDGLHSVEITEDDNLLFTASSLSGISYLNKYDKEDIKRIKDWDKVKISQLK